MHGKEEFSRFAPALNMIPEAYAEIKAGGREGVNIEQARNIRRSDKEEFSSFAPALNISPGAYAEIKAEGSEGKGGLNMEQARNIWRSGKE